LDSYSLISWAAGREILGQVSFLTTPLIIAGICVEFDAGTLGDDDGP
jgi:hypothetical protein